MKVLVACEESQRVCIAFRNKGHEAYSCDIEDCSGGHPEWHIKGDVLPILNGCCTFKTMNEIEHAIESKWDMIIAHPPCTKVSNAGARHLYKGGQGKLNIPRYYEGMCGKAFFMAIYNSDCEKIIIENPVPSKVFEYPKPTQMIQPYWFGHPFTKKTYLWIKGVEPLKPTNIVEIVKGKMWQQKNGKYRRSCWTMDKTKNRATERSKTFLGIAEAMADQWG